MSDGPQHPEHERVVTGSVASAISNGIVKTFAEYVGRGPTKARTTIDGDTVTTVLGGILTKAEHRLIVDGEAGMVLMLRQRYQQTMREDLIAVVEAATERKVIAFMSGNDLDADMCGEVFSLEPSARVTRV
jgi:uncharacterized protein YbcI